MNIGELRKIIYEEVVKAMRAEFREILTEAVTTVGEQRQAPQAPKTMPVRLADIVQEQEVGQPRSLTSLLQETATGMTREDYKAFTGTEQQVQQSQSVIAGMPDFLSKAIANAKGVFDASNRKDSERYGV